MTEEPNGSKAFLRWWPVLVGVVVGVASLGGLYLRLHDVEKEIAVHKTDKGKGHEWTVERASTLERNVALQLATQDHIRGTQQLMLSRLTVLEAELLGAKALLERIDRRLEKREKASPASDDE